MYYSTPAAALVSEHRANQRRVDINLKLLESPREKEVNRRLLEVEQKYQEERSMKLILEQKLEKTEFDSN